MESTLKKSNIETIIDQNIVDWSFNYDFNLKQIILEDREYQRTAIDCSILICYERNKMPAFLTRSMTVMEKPLKFIF